MRPSALRAALLLAGLVIAPALQAQSARAPERHHVIVLLDRSGSMRGSASGALEAAIRTDLRRLCFTPGLVDTVERALLDAGRGDVLSIMAFGLDFESAQSFDGFIAASEPWGVLRRKGAPQGVFDELWTNVSREGPAAFFTRSWSGISLAFPLALEYQGRNGGDTAEPVDRTFVVLVTDGEYNGDNPNQELGLLISSLRGLRPGSPLIAAERGVRQRLSRVQSDFHPEEREAADPGGRSIHVKVFEAVPNAVGFGIEAVWTFEHEAFWFRRVPRGFESEFPLRLVPNASAQPLELEARLMKGDSLLQRQVVPGTEREPKIRFSLPADAVDIRGLRVVLRARVRRMDVYGMQILSSDGPEPLKIAGLARTLPVALASPTRVFGLVPLPFWAFRIAAAVGFRSQEAASWFWTAVVLVIAAMGIRSVRVSRNPGSLKDESLLEPTIAGPHDTP